MANNATNQILQFAPFNSFVSVDFWTKLAAEKLNTFKLDDKAIQIEGRYVDPHNSSSNCMFFLDGLALGEDASTNNNNITVRSENG